MTDQTQKFSERLKAARNQAGLTQDDLADQMGVTKAAISRWESERGWPRVDSLPVLRALLGRSLDHLICGDPLPESIRAYAGMFRVSEESPAPYGDADHAVLAGVLEAAKSDQRATRAMALFNALPEHQQRALITLMRSMLGKPEQPG